jgi:hypothetical protein
VCLCSKKAADAAAVPYFVEISMLPRYFFAYLSMVPSALTFSIAALSLALSASSPLRMP